MSICRLGVATEAKIETQFCAVTARVRRNHEDWISSSKPSINASFFRSQQVRSTSFDGEPSVVGELHRKAAGVR